jgi:diguanylate cyclase (GGDEF)-like protein
MKRTPAERSASRQALAEAYAPIIRGFLLPCAAYYTFVTWGHWRDETGLQFVVLAGLSALTVFACLAMWRWLGTVRPVTLGRVELVGLVANVLIYANVALYMYLSFKEPKLIYFVLIAVVFATSGVTFRASALSVGLSMGTLFWFASTVSPVVLEQYLFIGVASSVVAVGMSYLLRKALRQQVSARLKADALTEHAQYLAATDMLTSLPSRRKVFDDIDAEVAARRPFWLGLIDLDGFKAINDAYGHALGDELLEAVAGRIRQALTGHTRFGRLGGDEFAWLLAGDLPQEAVEEAARDLILAISQPYRVAGRQVHVGATIGFCHCSSAATGSAEIYENADYALYAAKDTRRGDVLVFSEAHRTAMSQTSALERALREADVEAEFHLHFQPQFSTATGGVVGFEALARWDSPVLGPVRPDAFIRAAERSGQIIDLTPALLRKALAAAATWPAGITLSFNLSANDLADPSLAPTLLSAIDASGVSASRVQFELTETSVMRDIGRARSVLRQLADAGCSIALDDFGSGYSSFGYLNQLPLDTLKIDRGFIREVTTSAIAREIVGGMLRLGRTLGLTCVVEGVETAEELDILRPLGADVIQGYLLGAPMPPADIPAILAAHPGVAARTA